MIIIDNKTTPIDFLKVLLKNRNLKTAQEANQFLKPTTISQLTAKDFAINQKQLDKAVDRIKLAIKNQENILIYGDYDVDGITSTAILWNVLNYKKAKVLPFIPDRHLDGYGFKADSFLAFQKKNKTKFDLLITVDNGIVAHQQFKKVLKTNKDLDIIVTDHHLPGKKLPKEIITVHSTKVAGAGVSWFLSKQISSQADLSLATLGTVTDCMPLQGVNRSLVYYGLKTFHTNPNPGLKKIININNLKADSITSTDLGFIIGPRINAVGRLSNPTDALRLLCTSSPKKLSELAQVLDDHNRQRQNLQQKSLKLAKSKIDPKSSDKVLFVADKSFHPGLIGIIAGRLTDQHYLPSIIISIDGDIAKGSCRSIKELNILTSLKEISKLFIDLGGHPGAAGFTIETKKIPLFQKKITKIINQKLANKKLDNPTFIDAQLKTSAVTVKNCQLISKLEPFGIANTEPCFLLKDLQVVSTQFMGSKKEHLKIKVRDDQSSVPIDLLAFRQAEFGHKLNTGDLITCTARLNLNIWNGYTTPQLIVKELST